VTAPQITEGIFRQAPWNREVPKTKELARILSIPRRKVESDEAVELAKILTELLKTDRGKMDLRPFQALCLYDLGTYGGLVCLGRVGVGKTLISLLAPYVCESLRPLLLIPANLRTKTVNDRKKLRAHWEISPMMAIESYETLARKKQAHYLSLTKPDLIICDEAHHLKNTKASVTRRLKRYLKEHPNTKMVFLSGTLTNRSLKEYWHLLKWALPREQVPLPLEFSELERWSLALDEKIQPGNRVRPGALVHLCNEEERKIFDSGKKLKACRKAYSRRLVETPGIVATSEAFTGSALYLDPLQIIPPKNIRDAFEELRENWVLPDGQPISDGHIAAKNARELALGFFYRWNPRPPQEWLKARREWCRTVRHILANNRRNLDTEDQVKDAVAQGLYEGDTLWKWLAIKDTFQINVEPVWLSDFALKAAADWADKHRGIVWVQHIAFGERLQKLTGMSYYREGGFAEDGSFIEDHPKGVPMIASLKANKEGKNLQHWNTSLVTDSPSSGYWWEQLLGRLHREDQESAEVRFWVFGSCIEHYKAFYRAVGDAIYVQDSTPQIQKLLHAESNMPSLEDVEGQGGALWHEGTLEA